MNYCAKLEEVKVEGLKKKSVTLIEPLHFTMLAQEPRSVFHLFRGTVNFDLLQFCLPLRNMYIAYKF